VFDRPRVSSDMIAEALGVTPRAAHDPVTGGAQNDRPLGFDLLLVEDLAHRALDQLVEAGVALRWPILTSRPANQSQGTRQWNRSESHADDQFMESMNSSRARTEKLSATRPKLCRTCSAACRSHTNRLPPIANGSTYPWPTNATVLRTVLRGAEGEIPSAYSPSPLLLLKACYTPNAVAIPIPQAPPLSYANSQVMTPPRSTWACSGMITFCVISSTSSGLMAPSS
jgi:hypothetical protein